MSREVSKAQMERYKNDIKNKLIDNLDLFFENLAQLKPKDMCDTYLKMLPYGISKAPETLPTDENSKILVLEETKRKAALIAGGVQQEDTEDTDYEDDGWED